MFSFLPKIRQGGFFSDILSNGNFSFFFSLPNPSHVVLNHVYVAERKSSDVVVLGITQRFQQKTFTTVYYKHVDSIENSKKNHVF